MLRSCPRISAAFLFIAATSTQAQAASAKKADDVMEEVRTAATLLGTAEPRVRFCEGGKMKEAAEYGIDLARKMLAPHKQLSQVFEVDFQNNRKIEMGMLGAQYLNTMLCGPWGDRMIAAMNDLDRAVTAYKAAQPK